MASATKKLVLLTWLNMVIDRWWAAPDGGDIIQSRPSLKLLLPNFYF